MKRSVATIVYVLVALCTSALGIDFYDWAWETELTTDSVYDNTDQVDIWFTPNSGSHAVAMEEFRGHNKRLSIRVGLLVLPGSVWAGLLWFEVASGRLFETCDELVVSQGPAGAVVPTQRSQFCRTWLLS